LSLKKILVDVKQNPNDREKLYEIIIKNNIDFLILDVLGRMVPELDENNARDVGRLTNVLLKMRKELKLTILVLDHMRKGSGAREGRRPSPLEISGSVKKYGGSDFMITIARTKQKDAFLLLLNVRTLMKGSNSW